MSTSEPHTFIHVRNLQTNIPISIDAWGRPSPSQPVLISLSVSLKQPFSSASASDQVTSSTVHYGLLSKSVLRFCEGYTARVQSERNRRRDAGQEGWQQEIYMSLETFTNHVASHLYSPEGVLDADVVESLKVKVFLPKASLLGNGVSLTRVFGKGEGGEFGAKSSVLSLKELKIPCIIGVNPHEREAKQVVIAGLSLENWYLEGEEKWGKNGDLFTQLEKVVVEAIAPSSFQTLETLTTHITEALVVHFLHSLAKSTTLRGHPRIRILLEKPTAVTWADAPGVEVLVESDPSLNESIKALWDTENAK